LAEPFVGEIKLNAFNYAPQDWAQCNGQILQATQNAALFSLLGNRFGGNGSTTFALPDFRGRVPIMFGQGSGLSAYQIGNSGGSETVALTVSQMPAHNHDAQGVSAPGNTAPPSNNFFATTPTTPANLQIYATRPAQPAPGQLTTLHSSTIGNTGSGAGHNNMQPFLVLNFCIALVGYYPPRQ
jgi:microcystin-dependent protein